MTHAMRVAALFLGLPGVLQAQQAPPPVQAELLADATAVQPGEMLTLGVLLRIPPGWHIYWINPGDAGAPTQVRIRWPAGFAAGEVQFPVPERFDQPGDITGYGYAASVLLPVTAQAPRELKPGETVEFAAEVSWLCCKDVCVPEKASPHLKLPVAAARQPANMEWFSARGRQVPVPYESRGSPAEKVNISGSLAEADRGQFMIDVDWKTAVGDVEWLPGPDSAVQIHEIHVKTEGRHSRITFAVRVLPGQQVGKELLPGSIVAYTDVRGDRRGISVPIHLRASDPPRGDTARSRPP